LCKALGRPPGAILELGSGGGNTASHLAQHARLTLVDRSAAMLDVSRRLVPTAEHVHGDMRTVRLGTTFEAVLIHDAIMYMTNEQELLEALTTARTHLRPEGALIVLPDCVAETFAPGTETGGCDAGDGRGLRYISWSHAPAAGTTIETTDFAILMRRADGSVEVVHDRHICGLFPRDTWRAVFVRAGFAPPDIHRDPWRHDVLIARPAAPCGARGRL
jgi:SAM-dependent methyltransferase